MCDTYISQIAGTFLSKYHAKGANEGRVKISASLIADSSKFMITIVASFWHNL